MTQPGKRKRSSTELAKDMAQGAAYDPLGAFFILVFSIRYWKVTLIVLGLVLTVGLITGLVILWVNRWDI